MDDRTGNRLWGRSARGCRAEGVSFFKRGNRYSALGIFSVHGMLDCHIIPGGYSARKFLAAFRMRVLPWLNPYPMPRSVLVMDNCPNVHDQREIVTMCQDVGAIVHFLEPYDPHHMPIELAFRAAKQFMRHRKDELAHLPTRRERFRAALMSQGPSVGFSCFSECGYDMNY